MGRAHSGRRFPVEVVKCVSHTHTETILTFTTCRKQLIQDKWSPGSLSTCWASLWLVAIVCHMAPFKTWSSHSRLQMSCVYLRVSSTLTSQRKHTGAHSRPFARKGSTHFIRHGTKGSPHLDTPALPDRLHANPSTVQSCQPEKDDSPLARSVRRLRLMCAHHPHNRTSDSIGVNFEERVPVC